MGPDVAADTTVDDLTDNVSKHRGFAAIVNRRTTSHDQTDLCLRKELRPPDRPDHRARSNHAGHIKQHARRGAGCQCLHHPGLQTENRKRGPHGERQRPWIDTGQHRRVE